MKGNKMTDLNDGLFAQFYRLQNEELSGKKLEEEISRSRASVEVAQTLISGAALAVQACRIAGNESRVIKLPPMLTE
jgi:hypothetical protein